MKYYLLSLFLFLILVACHQPNKNENVSANLDEQVTPIVKSFFESIQSGNYKIALVDLLKKNENIDLQDTLTIILKNKFNYLNESSGRFVSEKSLRNKYIGNDLGIYSYFVKYEKKFYRFVFTFYDNGSKVRVYKFSFDDNIDIELEEAMKLYVN